MEAITAFLVSTLGPVLWKVFETLLEKGKDIALEKGFEPLKQLVDSGYDERKDAESLRQAVLSTLDELKKDKAFDPYDQLLATWKLTNLNDKTRLALAGAAVEMTQFSPSVVSSELLTMLNLGEDKRNLLARFLFELRNQLKNTERFKVGIQYANEMDSLGALRGLSSQMIVVAERLATLVGYEEALIKERRLTTDDAQALRDYLAEARKKWEGVMLPLLRQKNGTIRDDTKLKQVFVPLNLRDVHAEEESRRKMDRLARPEKMANEQMEQIQPIEIGELLNRHSRFILIGAPGCGKTTLLSRVALAFAEGRAQADLGWKGKNLLPIFLRLRNFGAFLKENRDKYSAPSSGALIAYLENLSRDGDRIRLTADFFDRRLDEGNCLVLMDGLDEVSDLRCEVAGYVDAFVDRYARKENRNLIGLASRPRGYESVEIQLHRIGLAVAEVNPLNLQGIRQLMENLLKLIEPDSTCRAEDLEELTRAVGASDELTRIAGTPLFCSALVQVFKYHGKHLPDRRVDVFDEIVALLLGHWHAQQTRYIREADQLAMEDGTGKAYGKVEKAVFVKRARLSKLALSMQETHQAEIPAQEAEKVLYDYLKSRERVPDDETAQLWAENFLLNSHERSGLLAERDPGIYTFLHKGFMEYLAASALIQQSGKLVEVLLALVEDKQKFEWWEQVILLAGAHPGTPEDVREELIDCLLAKVETYPKDSEESLRHLILAGNLARDMGEDLLPAAQYMQVETVLFNAATDPTLAPLSRASAADTLDEMGYLPEDLYKFVPITNFYLAKYLVTNIQYERFLKPENFKNKDLWINFPKYDENSKLMDETWGGQPWNWLQKELQDKDNEIQDGVLLPRYWRDLRFGINRRHAPVVGISWYEASAYCKWLTQNWQTLPEAQANSPFLLHAERSSLSFRLPLEKEWSLAAGGEENNRFAFGELKDPVKEITAHANTGESGINRTTPVWMYPQGKSPLEVMDMSGNVWEWQANYYNVKDGGLALRGGSWYFDRNGARVSARIDSHPSNQWSNFGFRVCCSPPSR
jgi:formylglycine-generating enzyme required for sulfatase activity